MTNTITVVSAAGGTVMNGFSNTFMKVTPQAVYASWYGLHHSNAPNFDKLDDEMKNLFKYLANRLNRLSTVMLGRKVVNVPNPVTALGVIVIDEHKYYFSLRHFSSQTGHSCQIGLYVATELFKPILPVAGEGVVAA